MLFKLNIKFVQTLNLNQRYYHEAPFFYMKPKENCTLCNLNELRGSPSYFCPVYTPILAAFRYHYLPYSVDTTRPNFKQLFKIDNVDSLWKFNRTLQFSKERTSTWSSPGVKKSERRGEQKKKKEDKKELVYSWCEETIVKSSCD